MKNQAHCSSHIHHKLCLAASFPLVLKHIFSYQLLCSILLKMHRVQIRFFSRGARHHQLPPEICLLSPPPTFPSCHYDSSVILSPSHQPKCLGDVHVLCRNVSENVFYSISILHKKSTDIFQKTWRSQIFQISKCPKVTVISTYGEDSGEISKLSEAYFIPVQLEHTRVAGLNTANTNCPKGCSP